jgi:septal ring factor EnvC (AmiA/AmiB activator)
VHYCEPAATTTTTAAASQQRAIDNELGMRPRPVACVTSRRQGMPQSDAERAASYRARQQAKRHDEITALRRRVAELDAEVAGLGAENAILRDDKAALTAEIERLKTGLAATSDANMALSKALRAARQAVKKEPAKAAPRRGKDPLAKYLWPSPRK